MPRKNTLQEWFLEEATKLAKEHLRELAREGVKHAGPALKKVSNHVQALWANRAKRPKKNITLEVINNLRRELHSERLAHERTKKRLRRALNISRKQKRKE